MTTLTLRQLNESAVRQSSNLSAAEKIVYAYLEAKVHHHIDGLTTDAKVQYDHVVNLLPQAVLVADHVPIERAS